MVSLNKKVNYIHFATGLFPAVLSSIFLINQSWIMLAISILSLFVIVGTVPVFKRRESIYMFIFVAILSLPMNIKLAYWLIEEGFIGFDFFLGNLCWGILVCFILFSVEELIFGIITRMIWKKQYKLPLYY